MIFSRHNVIPCLIAVILVQPIPLAAQPAWEARIDVVDPSESGIAFVHTDGAGGERTIVETVLGSLALFDYDNDGLIDIYFINGAPLRGRNINPPPRNQLYRNNGNWTFTNVTEPSGLGDLQYGMGVVVSDYDQDGDADVFLSNFGTDAFYINQGDGTFVESAKACGLDAPLRIGAGSSFLDMDNDGDLDLYSASYVSFDYSKHKTRTIAGRLFHTGPNDYEPAAHYMYRNEGNGTFTDVSDSSGIGALRAPGMGVLSADLDEDGDMDIFVANDQRPNFLLINDGKGHFHDDALFAGVAVDRQGRSNGNMAVDIADFNGDGWLDLFTTTYQEEMPVLYQAVSPGLFSDSTNLSRIDPTLNAHVKWGGAGVDFDNDGDRDLFVACGHFLDNIRFIDDRTDVKVPNYLLANDGRGRFTNVSGQAGSALKIVESSRGAAFDDLDNDGDVDLVVLNVNAQATVGRTVSLTKNHSLSLQLVGIISNRDAIGAKVVAHSSQARPQTQIVVSGRGYESSYGKRLIFGSGGERITTVEVLWPSGRHEWFDGLTSTAVLVEGHGKAP